MINKTLITATGSPGIDSAVKRFSGYDVIASSPYRSELEASCDTYKPEILLVAEMLNGNESLPSILMKIKSKNPNIRIVYLAGEVNLKNEKEVNQLGLLIMSGIYDIVSEKTMTIDMLRNSLNNVKTEQDVDFISKVANKNNNVVAQDKNIEFVIPEEYEERNEDMRNNLFVISSIKPGTGKSFVSANIATAIAQYGVDMPNGKRPRVGLIEADLQNLSLGTLLQIEDSEKNVKTAMEKIGEIISETGDLFGNDREIEEVNHFVKRCFIPYRKISNLKALVGSQLTFEEMEAITNHHYIYLIDSIMDEFDVIIVDTNSALTHVTTYPLLHMSKSCYYVLNLDFNNVRNNLRYKETLERIGIGDKVRYILNEDITAADEVSEKLIFTADHLADAGFELEARIPVIPKTTFLNKLYEGTPIVLDEKKENAHIKNEILKVSNQIYPIKGFSNDESSKESKTKRFFK